MAAVKDEMITGMDKDDWVKSRTKLAVEKWDAFLEANVKQSCAEALSK